MAESNEKKTDISEVGPTDPTRVRTFARFFKNYMSISAVVTAALPIPVTSLKLIPTYTAQTSILSTYTSLFCFLTLGFLFYSRHQLGRLMFPEFLNRSVSAKISSKGDAIRYLALAVVHYVHRFQQSLVAFLPAIFILLSLLCVFYYHSILDGSLRSITSMGGGPKSSILLSEVELYRIPNEIALMFWYLGIFVFAEAAFVTMAMKEYIQDLVKLSEIEIIGRGRPVETGSKPAGSKSGP
jgi:hypothetical protein